MAIITAFEAMYYLERGILETGSTGWLPDVEFFLSWFEDIPFQGGVLSYTTRLLAWGTMQYLPRMPSPPPGEDPAHQLRPRAGGLKGVARREASRFLFPEQIASMSIYFPIAEWKNGERHLTDVSTLTVRTPETTVVTEIVWSRFDSRTSHFNAAWGGHSYKLVITGAAGLPREVAPPRGEVSPVIVGGEEE